MGRRDTVTDRTTALGRVRTAIVVLVSVVGSALLSLPPAPAASGAAVPSCDAAQLSVTAHDWVYNPSTVGTVFEVLPIAITNNGATCVLVGTPKIAPTGVRLRHVNPGAATSIIVSGAAVTPSPARTMTLARGHAAYTYLYLVYPIGNTATASKWRRACAPSTATGLTIFVVPGHSIWNRHVAVTVPEVCTTGKANDLRSGPLSSTHPH